MSQAPVVYAHIPACACAAATVLLSIAGIRPGEQTVRTRHICICSTPLLFLVALSSRYVLASVPCFALTLMSFLFRSPHICACRRCRAPFHSRYSAWRGDGLCAAYMCTLVVRACPCVPSTLCYPHVRVLSHLLHCLTLTSFTHRNIHLNMTALCAPLPPPYFFP